jgi:hypothetical protein
VIAGEAENLPRIQARERVKIMEKIYNLAEKKSRQEQKTSV